MGLPGDCHGTVSTAMAMPWNWYGNGMGRPWDGGAHAMGLSYDNDTTLTFMAFSWHFHGAFMAPHGASWSLFGPHGIFIALHGNSWQYNDSTVVPWRSHGQCNGSTAVPWRSHGGPMMALKKNKINVLRRMGENKAQAPTLPRIRWVSI